MSPLAKLAGRGPPAEEKVAPGMPLGPCDATASGSEDAQVRLAKGRFVLALCAHHFAELEFMLAVAGWRVTQDNRSWQSLPRQE